MDNKNDFKSMTSEEQYNSILDEVKGIYTEKNALYGDSLNKCRLTTFIDLIYIKVLRAKQWERNPDDIQIKDEKLDDCFLSIINYSLMVYKTITYQSYSTAVNQIKTLFSHKNNDYQEAWRIIEVSSMIDIIEIKILRLKQMYKSNDINMSAIEDCYKDIVNYAIFCLIRFKEGTL